MRSTIMLAILLLSLTAIAVPQNQPNANVNAIIQRGEQLNARSEYNEAIVEFKRALDFYSSLIHLAAQCGYANPRRTLQAH